MEDRTWRRRATDCEGCRRVCNIVVGRRSVFWSNASVYRQRILREVTVKVHILISTAAALLWTVTIAAAQQSPADMAAKIKEEAAKPTPRLADGALVWRLLLLFLRPY